MIRGDRGGVAVALVAGALLGGGAWAQEGATTPPVLQTGDLREGGGSGELRPMETDRPNKTNSPRTVDAGHVQIEFGAFTWSYSQSRGAKPWEHHATFAQTNVRVGVMDMLEVNLVVNPAVYSKSGPEDGGEDETGFGDLVVGGKVNLWGREVSDEVWASGLGLQPQVKIPTASDDVGNGDLEMSLGAPFLLNMPEEIHLSVQPSITWQREGDEDHQLGWEFAVALDRDLFDLFNAYVEYWTHIGQDQKPRMSINVGVSWPLSDRCALDTGVNLGLNDATADIEWTAGVSFKF